MEAELKATKIDNGEMREELDSLKSSFKAQISEFREMLKTMNE